MYTEYFGLKEKPFSIAPDPQCFYMSQGHREALAHLLYGIKSEGGFVLLTGEVGTGKTTVCRLLLELIPPDTETAFILNPKVTADELLATICDEFQIEYPSNTTSVKVLVSRISDFLLKVHEKGRKAVLILEEAQNLTTDVLEQIRLLTNLETKERKLLQIIMLGQPELRDILSKPELLQLSQRITARYHLGPLLKKEVPAYVNYRLSAAGLLRGHPFPASTLRPLFALTRGVPRLINIILDRALLGAFAEGKDRVDRKTLFTAAREVAGRKNSPRNRLALQAALIGLVLIACTTLFLSTPYPFRAKAVNALFPASSPNDLIGKAKVSPQRGVRGNISPATLTDRDEAYAALFSEWQIEYKRGGGQTVCEQAVSQGLHCLEGRGTMANLRQMNKPVVLVLSNEGGGKRHATLTALQGDRASLTVGGATRTIDIRQIEGSWSGDYLLIWRGPPKIEQPLKPGDRGPLVAWLDRQLSVMQGRQPRVGNGQVYTEEIVKQVKEFQRTAGLEPDGIVGPRTVMHISAVAGERGPVLQRKTTQ